MLGIANSRQFISGDQNNRPVDVEGGRYDVDIPERLKKSVYWEEEHSQVRRCSWFYRPEGDSHFVPYDEKFAAGLEVTLLIVGKWFSLLCNVVVVVKWMVWFVGQSLQTSFDMFVPISCFVHCISSMLQSNICCKKFHVNFNQI